MDHLHEGIIQQAGGCGNRAWGLEKKSHLMGWLLVKKLSSPDRPFRALARSKLRRIGQISNTVMAYTISYLTPLPAFQVIILSIHRLLQPLYSFSKQNQIHPLPGSNLAWNLQLEIVENVEFSKNIISERRNRNARH